MRKIRAYHCDFCKRITVSKIAMEKHENVCLHNPEMKSCATCDNLFYLQTPEKPQITCCRCDMLKPDAGNKKNPNGLQIHCKKWTAKHPGEMQ